MVITESISSAYAGKKVFLTGHTGFKGSWLLLWLRRLGAEVKGYSLAPSQKDALYNRIHGDTHCTSVIADIKDAARLETEIADFAPDFIFHLAAQAIVKTSYESPVDTFVVNAIGTANVLNSVRKLDKPCSVVIITTDKVYHNNEWIYPYRENDPLGGYDPYSASKACAELVTSSFRNSFFNPLKYDSHQKGIASARAGNVIGGGDWSDFRLVPDIIRSLSRNEPVTIRNPNSVRPWQHVLDPLYGYLVLGAALRTDPRRYADCYNFGPDMKDNVPVQAVVEMFIEQWGSGTMNIDKQEHQHEAGLLALDTNKAFNNLGWVPGMDLRQVVMKTVECYKAMLNQEDVQIVMQRQIDQFMQ
jgi:CDP-glucose 4,6-dehydratase